MLIKNKSARAWHVAGVLVAPLAEVEVECQEADVKGNGDLEIVKPVSEKMKPGPKPAPKPDGEPKLDGDKAPE